MEAIIPAFILVLFGMFLYTCYKVIWYTNLLLRFRRRLRKAGVTPVPSFSALAFGRRCDVRFTVTVEGKEREVRVLTFISNHSRWNIEKTRQHYYLEVRRYNNIFYDGYYNTGPEPEHSKDYRRESRMYRGLTALAEGDGEGEKKILLVHPRPNLLTYASTNLAYLRAGDCVAGYEILYEEDFFALLGDGTKKGKDK